MTINSKSNSDAQYNKDANASDDESDKATSLAKTKKKFKTLGEAVKAVTETNFDWAAFYREMADEAKSDKIREACLELERRVLRDQQEFIDVISGNIKCPQCGSWDQTLIIYGNSDSKPRDGVLYLSKKREENDPRWLCNDCGFRWQH